MIGSYLSANFLAATPSYIYIAIQLRDREIAVEDTGWAEMVDRASMIDRSRISNIRVSLARQCIKLSIHAYTHAHDPCMYRCAADLFQP